MLHRLGISMDQEELKHIDALQKRFGIRSRSEFFRELVVRYEKLEHQLTQLNQCVTGYMNQPEIISDQDAAILKTSLKALPEEKW